MKFDTQKKKKTGTEIKLKQKQIMNKPITCRAKLLAKRERAPTKRVKSIENKWPTDGILLRLACADSKLVRRVVL